MAASVLIIDAEEEFAHQLADALRDEGIEPAVTGDGKDGFELAKITVPSAIVLCVELPRTSGYSICAKLKKDTALKEIPLIITSAEATPETFEHHKKLKTRAEEYLKKPFAPAMLVELLRQHVPAAVGNGAKLSGRDRSAVEISDDLSMDEPPPTVGDEEAFSEEEVRSMTEDARGLPGDQTRVGDPVEALFALSRSGGDANPLTQAAGVSANDEDGFVSSGFEPDDEVMTNVGEIPTSVAVLQRELDQVREELEAARKAQARAERERDHAVTERPQAGSASQPPSASREALALKKELNIKERELLELKERFNSKEKEILAQRDRETELEGQVVQLEEEVASVQDGRTKAEERARRLEEAKEAAEGKIRALETKAQGLETRAAGAEGRAAQNEKRAAAAEAKASQTEAKLAQADTKSQGLEARLSAVEARLLEKERTSEQTIQDLNRRLGEAAAHEAELDGAIQTLTAEGGQLREKLGEREKTISEREKTLAEREKTIASQHEHIQTLRSANQTQNQEINRVTNELAAATAEAEGLRQQLTEAQKHSEELEEKIASLEGDVAKARGEIEALQATLHELEQNRELSEGRIARAYQKIRDDEKIKGKARKAIEIALALLQEAGYAPESESSVGQDAQDGGDEARS